MTSARPLAVPIAVLVAAAMAGCGPKRVQQLRPGQAQVVLLPDPGDGAVGRAVVSNPAGGVELAAARESTTASSGQAPAPVTVLSEADANRLFGDVLSTLPPAPLQFVLYFRFESDDLTDESRALLPRVLEALRNRPFPDVAVIGHTDTTGAAAANVELGLQARQRDSRAARSGGHQRGRHRGDLARRVRPPGEDRRPGARAAQPPRRNHGEMSVQATPCRPRVRRGAGGDRRAAVALPSSLSRAARVRLLRCPAARGAERIRRAGTS